MTCIVGIVGAEGDIHMGGDSAVVCIDNRDSTKHYTVADKKVFIKDNVVMGCAGPSRFCQALRCSLDIPNHLDSQSDFDYMVLDFASAVKSCVGGALLYNPADFGASLVGYNGCLYLVERDLTIVLPRHNFIACGAGAMYAMGVLAVTGHMNCEDRIRLTLETVASLSSVVELPIDIVSLRIT